MVEKKQKVTKTKPKPKPKKEVKTEAKKEPVSLGKYFDRLNDTNKFILVKSEFMKDLPIQTHIGYVYQSSNGDLIPVVSAFIQSHYVSEGGLSGMLIKCGNRVYANLYQSIVKIYIYKTDYEKVLKTMHHNKLHNPFKPSPEEMAVRIQQLEKTLSELTTKLVRSTSTLSIPKKVAKEKPKKNIKRSESFTSSKIKNKPVVF